MGKLKQEDREEEQSEQEQRQEEGGAGRGGKDAKGVCGCSLGQFMALSSRALITMGGFKLERPVEKTHT